MEVRFIDLDRRYACMIMEEATPLKLLSSENYEEWINYVKVCERHLIR
jgi:hypothetical protein